MGDGGSVHLSFARPAHKSSSVQDPPAPVVAPLPAASLAHPLGRPTLLGVSSADTSMVSSPPLRALMMFLSKDMACSQLPLNKV
jgi:hypothetical protein